jgi:hypothetical protein
LSYSQISFRSRVILLFSSQPLSGLPVSYAVRACMCAGRLSVTSDRGMPEWKAEMQAGASGKELNC